MNQLLSSIDPHAQLRALYMALLNDQEHFDEFKQLLGLYRGVSLENADVEPEPAAEVRRQLNARIRQWTRLPEITLSPLQVLQWRGIIVEERINVSIAPWKESNFY